MTTITAESDRYIVFTIGIHNVALPINQVLRVVRNHSINVQPSDSTHPEALQSMGLIQVGKRLIRVLSLEQLFTPMGSIAENAPPLLPSAPPLPEIPSLSFFVITKNHQNELCGIPTATPPNLMDWPQEWVQPLPSSRQDSNLSQIVSHFVTLTHADTTCPIFLLQL